jgi:molecular chaperone DnaJ
MPTKDYYSTLWVNKSATDAEIKKAYKKQAMQYHPDRNKGDKKAEAKFKEINEAYQILGDKEKKKNYDQFGSAEGNPFGWANGNPFGGGTGWYRQSSGGGNFWGFEDIFSQFSWAGWGNQWFEFDLGDIFGGWKRSRKSPWEGGQRGFAQEEPKKEIPNLDVTETIEIPFFDFLSDRSIDVRTIYGKHLTLKVKAGTKPGTKFKITGKWRTSEGKTGDMYVIVDAKMPKTPLDPHVEKMVEAIKYQV